MKPLIRELIQLSFEMKLLWRISSRRVFNLNTRAREFELLPSKPEAEGSNSIWAEMLYPRPRAGGFYLPTDIPKHPKLVFGYVGYRNGSKLLCHLTGTRLHLVMHQS